MYIISLTILNTKYHFQIIKSCKYNFDLSHGIEKVKNYEFTSVVTSNDFIRAQVLFSITSLQITITYCTNINANTS